MPQEDASAVAFRDYTQPIGGPFDTTQLNDRERRAFETYASCVEECRDDGIYVGFINNGQVNAVAFTYQGRECIGINTGTVYGLNTVAIAIARCFNLADLSCSSVEEMIDRAVYKELKAEFQSGRMQSEKPSSPPNLTPAQRDVAVAIIYMGMTFVLAHEYAHFSQGHMEFMKLRGGKSNVALYEAEPSLPDDSQGITSTERTALEVDADAHGVNAALARDYSNFGVNNALKYVVQDLAMSVLFFQFMMSSDSIEEYRGYHPHALVRESIGRRLILSFLDEYAEKETCDRVEAWFTSKALWGLQFELKYMMRGPFFIQKWRKDPAFIEREAQRVLEESRPTWSVVDELGSKRAARKKASK